MSTDLVTAQAAYTAEQRALITDVLCKGASSLEVDFFMQVAERCRLDPFRRQIHAVKRWDNSLRRETLTFQVGIDGLRAIAARTGEYAGNDEPAFELDGNGNPVKATCTVFRFVKGQRVPFTASVFWREYCQTKKDGALTAMWAQRPFGQLGKCAEAAALRKAFPEDAGQLYTEEEIAADSEIASGAPAPKPGPRMPTTGSFLVQQQVPTPGVVEKPALGDAGAARPNDGAHTIIEAEAATPVIPWHQLLGGKWRSAKISQGPDSGCIIADLPAAKVAAMRQDGWLKGSQPALWEALMASLYESIIAALKKSDKTPADFEQYLKDAGAFSETNTLLALSSDDLPDMAEHVKRYLAPVA
jgi:phage recombination protein Bet